MSRSNPDIRASSSRSSLQVSDAKSKKHSSKSSYRRSRGRSVTLSRRKKRVSTESTSIDDDPVILKFLMEQSHIKQTSKKKSSDDFGKSTTTPQIKVEGPDVTESKLVRRHSLASVGSAAEELLDNRVPTEDRLTTRTASKQRLYDTIQALETELKATELGKTEVKNFVRFCEKWHITFSRLARLKREHYNSIVINSGIHNSKDIKIIVEVLTNGVEKSLSVDKTEVKPVGSLVRYFSKAGESNKKSSPKRRKHLKASKESPKTPKRQISNSQLLENYDVRTRIANEIFDSEKQYKSDIELIIQCYLKKLQEEPMIDKDDIRVLFEDLEVIKNFSNILQGDLKTRIDTWAVCQNIGDVFLDAGFVEHLKVYTRYVNGYNARITTLMDIKKRNSKFRAYLERQEVQYAADLKGRYLSDLLIAPIQRLPRYLMLLEKLLEETPESHPDHVAIKAATEKMSNVANYVNEKKREAENLKQVLTVEYAISDCPNLGEPHRRYLYSGSVLVAVNKKFRKFEWHLFNDMIVESKSTKQIFGSKIKLNFKRIITLSGSSIIELKKNPYGGDVAEVLVLKAKKTSCIFVGEKEGSEAKWERHISAAIRWMKVARTSRRNSFLLSRKGSNPVKKSTGSPKLEDKKESRSDKSDKSDKHDKKEKSSKKE